MTFYNPPSGDRRAAFRDEKTFSAYRRLGMLFLDRRAIREAYGVQAVAISPQGLSVFVERPLDDEDPFQRSADVPITTRVTGPILAASRGGEQIWDASRSGSGTFGCLVQDAEQRTLGLTCDHVVGTLAGQRPGDVVRCRNAPAHSFLRGSSVAISTVASNRVDAAVFTLGGPPNAGILGITGAPSGVNRALSFGDLVSKSGAATGVTTGAFSYIVTMVVPYGAGPARFVDQLGIDGGGAVFADQGDSGAVVLDAAGKVAGLLFAAAPQSCLGFANPIDDVEADLGVSVL